MIFGDCPYDDGCDGTFAEPLPDKVPCFGRMTCETCGRSFWTRFSRVDSWSLTEIEFLAEYDVDALSKTITKRTP